MHQHGEKLTKLSLAFDGGVGYVCVCFIHASITVAVSRPQLSAGNGDGTRRRRVDKDAREGARETGEWAGMAV